MIKNLTKCYDSNFYDNQSIGSYQSAKVILGILFQAIKVRSILDVGCGVGTWLRAAKELGCRECVGVEGKWVVNKMQPKNGVIIKIQNLEKKIKINKKYNLTISMEVAEHLTPKRAKSFVRDLCRSSDIILFSAATPAQGGVNHLNEKPISFWASIFLKHGFIPFDVIRPLVKHNTKVEPWYRKNSILFISNKKITYNKILHINFFKNILDQYPPNGIFSSLEELKKNFKMFQFFVYFSLKWKIISALRYVKSAKR